MNYSEQIKKFKEYVKVGISWNKPDKKLHAVLENSSDDITFYYIQGEFLFFNSKKRLVGGHLVVYKYLKPGQLLFDDFEDMETKISDNIETVVFKPVSVEMENPYISTSVEEKAIEEGKIKRVFDTDLLNLPEITD